MNKLQIVYYYGCDDEDCGGDYYNVELLINDVSMCMYGDYYHEKGEVAVEAWAEGYILAMAWSEGEDYEWQEILSKNLIDDN